MNKTVNMKIIGIVTTFSLFYFCAIAQPKDPIEKHELGFY